MSRTGMIPSKILLFSLLAGTALGAFLIADHLINYKTWGDNKDFFIGDFHGFRVDCDVNYFAEPSNCRTVYENGTQVPNELAMRVSLENCSLETNENNSSLTTNYPIDKICCYGMWNGNVLPCTLGD